MESRNMIYTSEHVISDEAFDLINSELLTGNQWIAYNTASYFLDKNDVFFLIKKIKQMILLKAISVNKIIIVL